MILRDIHLYPDLVDYSDDITIPFRHQSRSICNYLEKQLKTIKYKTKNFNRICIIGKSEPSDEYFINSCNVLTIEVSFSEKQYKTLGTEKRNELFFDMLVEGFTKMQNTSLIPSEQLLGFLHQFRENEYINEGIFKSKSFKKYKLQCDLYYKFTQSEFQLHIRAFKNEEMIFEKEILNTEPNEIVFVPKFKDLKIENENIIVTDAKGEAIYRLSLQDLLNG